MSNLIKKSERGKKLSYDARNKLKIIFLLPSEGGELTLGEMFQKKRQ